MGRRRRVFFVGAGAAAIALLALGARLAGAVGGGAGDWATVERRDLVLGVPVSGTLEAVHSDLLGPPQVPDTWSFKISFMAPEGATVKAGTPVLRFDTHELESKLAEAEAASDSATKELEKARTDFDQRREELELNLAEAKARLRKAELKTSVPAELAAAQELATARIDLDLARREVTSLEARAKLLAGEATAALAAQDDERAQAAARVDELRQAVARMTVRAPRDGTVIYAAPRGRAKKKVGDTAWRPEKVIEIPDLERMRAEGEVDEADAGRVAVGQPVNLTLDAHPDVTYHGKVAAIHRVVERRSANNPVKVVRLDVDLDATDTGRMRPAMRFQGTIEIERIAGALAAPADAVFGSAAGPVAFRRTLFGVEEVRPTVGRRSGEWVEVTAGLAAGDRLARRPPAGWEEGR